MPSHQISIKHFFTAKPLNYFARIGLGIIDKLLGISYLNKLYQANQFNGLSAHAFTDKFIHVFKLSAVVSGFDLTALPKNKPIVVVANHPFGGVEGVVLANLMAQVRPDVKILANVGLSIFPELAPYFIYTNPLKTGAKGNFESLKRCRKHLENKGLLVIFPAGRVSYHRNEFKGIADHDWHRSLQFLAKVEGVQLLPLHIAGQNRPLFYQLGRVYFRFRLLMLIREMIASKGRNIPMTFAKKLVTPYTEKNDQQNTDLTRLLTYLQDPKLQLNWPKIDSVTLQPLATFVEPALLLAEVQSLPEEQQLAKHKQFVVYYAQYDQIPHILQEIRIRREEAFRLYDEGSGHPQDGDERDKTYTHLFVFDREVSKLVGAYRMGQTDILREQGGNQALYLAQMFNFNADFINQQQPCLEMGRSFVVPDYQKSYHSLLLLFKGIARFIARFPRYQTLYGTVSLTTQYSPLSVYLIQRFLVKPTDAALPKLAFEHAHSQEVSHYLSQYPADINELEWLVKQIEPDGKGLPVLLKQYHQLGAQFYCLGIDPNFAQTPGLLLSVHLPTAPKRFLKLYLGDELERYLARQF
ncbi:lysophospholipid acyltransferase family protein [Algibacillus agarilyticus]|uniref:lysophospholipid acyltransferase family protein n=1 Tax=Algibacillus agarilyticus TaxID=2234133 RepID=UPI000DD021F7|nr:GNAT family N-acyltransferase [Algibacillus agarilyticus]